MTLSDDGLDFLYIPRSYLTLSGDGLVLFLSSKSYLTLSDGGLVIFYPKIYLTLSDAIWRWVPRKWIRLRAHEGPIWRYPTLSDAEKLVDWFFVIPKSIWRYLTLSDGGSLGNEFVWGPTRVQSDAIRRYLTQKKNIVFTCEIRCYPMLSDAIWHGTHVNLFLYQIASDRVSHWGVVWPCDPQYLMFI